MNPEIKAQLEKYMMANGYYDTVGIRVDEGMDRKTARFFDMFGGNDADAPEQMSNLLAAATAANDALYESQHNEAQAAAEPTVTVTFDDPPSINNDWVGGEEHVTMTVSEARQHGYLPDDADDADDTDAEAAADAPAPAAITVGSVVRVLPHTICRDLFTDTVVSPMRERQHKGYRRTIVTGLDTDGMKTIVEVKVGDNYDYVRPEAIEVLEAPEKRAFVRTPARFYVRVARENGTNVAFYGPYPTRGLAQAAVENLEQASVWTHTEMVKEFGREFEMHPERFLEASRA